METVDVIANKIGYVRQSIFGGLWEFESNEIAKTIKGYGMGKTGESVNTTL